MSQHLLLGRHALSAMLMSCLFSGAAMAQQFVYPKNSQSQQQQQQDEYQCHQWAVDQSGFDPTKAYAQVPTAPQPSTRNRPRHARNALIGAGRGYVIGKVADGDTNKAWKAGAVQGLIGGALRNRSVQRRQAQYGQQQQARQRQSQSDGQQTYLRARATCLEARGYSVG